MSIIDWKGNKYVWHPASAAWYGHYGKKGDDYPGDNMMVPIRVWGHLFQEASAQGITINRSKPRSHDEVDEDGEIIVKKIGKSKKSEKKFIKSISIFGE